MSLNGILFSGLGLARAKCFNWENIMKTVLLLLCEY